MSIRRKGFSLILGVFLFISLLFAYAVRLNMQPDDVLTDNNSEQSNIEPANIQSTKSETKRPSTHEEVRGMWVASVLNLDFPSAPDLSSDTLRHELDKIVENAKNWGLGTIFFQVRPSADALYNSNIFPISKFLSTEGLSGLEFDPLEYIIKKSHGAGLELHAWINPLRITTGTPSKAEHDTELLPQSSPARKNPEWTVNFADGKMYFDAAYPEIRQLVTDGVLEIIRNYDVDGIHFDDYFYPYPISGATFDDSKSYERYGNGRSLEDFRRENINALIRQVYNAIKAENEKVAFGISPYAVWRRKTFDPLGFDTHIGIESYSELYADSRKWIKEGILDYICPQIYWNMTQEGLEYPRVYDWWENCVAGTNVTLLVGHTLSKFGQEQGGWDKPKELIKQIEYSAQSKLYGGSVFFRYNYLLQNPLGVTDELKNYYWAP